MATSSVSALRSDSRVSNVELFFDLVYVFAVTQLSHLLLEHPTAAGALRAAVVLGMVWQVWVYTTWAVNYLNPDRLSTRGMLLLVMLGSLVLAAGIPQAYHGRAGLVAGAYVAIQLGRTLYSIWALRGETLQLVFVRILPWSALTSAIVIVGANTSENVQAGLWALAVAIDLTAGAFGFWTPWLGGSATTDWTIDGAHFAERCQAFVLIALGESVVVIGGLGHFDHPSFQDLAAFGAAFAGVVALWWIYFDHAAEASSAVIEAHDDPGRLARNAFHYVHPVIIAGIIVTAAADEEVLHDPTADAHGPVPWFVLGGTALFLAGHALFKFVITGQLSWTRVVAAAVLLALVPLAYHATVLAVGCLALAAVVAVAIADRVVQPPLNPGDRSPR